MLLSVEIKQKISNKFEELKKLKAENKIDEAVEVANEIEVLNKELKLALLEEERENQIANNSSERIEDKVNETSNVDVNRVFNKLLTNQSVTDEEMKSYQNSSDSKGQLGSVDERGGYLLPKEQELEIYEFRRSLNSLKNLCRIKKVTTRSGIYNVEVADTLELLAFNELEDLQENHLTFAQKEWSIADYGILHKISNTLLRDLQNTSVKITDFCGRKFAKASIRTENKKIAEELKKATAVTIKDINEIKDVLNVKLDPSISATSKIITNQTSFNYLDKLVDKNGLPLLSTSLNNPMIKTFGGKEIVVFADSEIESSNKTNLIFYVGDIEEYITFYERQGYEVGVSSDAGFKMNATWIRMIERFGVGVVDDKALYKLEMTPPKGA